MCVCVCVCVWKVYHIYADANEKKSEARCKYIQMILGRVKKSNNYVVSIQNYVKNSFYVMFRYLPPLRLSVHRKC